MKITFYTRDNCMLCKEGELQLELAIEDLDVTVQKINIDDDELLEKYMLEVPVVVHNDEIIQSGQLDFVTIYDYVKNQ